MDKVTATRTKDGLDVLLVDSGFAIGIVRQKDAFRHVSTWVGPRHPVPELSTGDMMPTGWYPTHAEAVAARDVMVQHQVDVMALGRVNSHAATLTAGGKPIRTPWGPCQDARVYAPGVTSMSTAGHGGFKLSAEMNRKVPEPMRVKDGWYEEDGEWAKVAHALPHLFTDYERAQARKSLETCYPDELEAVTGETIPLERSSTKRKRVFAIEHANSLVVVSAINSSTVPGMVECHAREGGHDGKGESRKFLVPSGEYGARGEFGFVIDEALHEEMLDAPSPGMH